MYAVDTIREDKEISPPSSSSSSSSSSSLLFVVVVVPLPLLLLLHYICRDFPATHPQVPRQCANALLARVRAARERHVGSC